MRRMHDAGLKAKVALEAIKGEKTIAIERLWRTVKYEEVYLHEYESTREAKKQLNTYFEFYNEERFHSSLNRKTPAEIYFGRKI